MSLESYELLDFPCETQTIISQSLLEKLIILRNIVEMLRIHIDYIFEKYIKVYAPIRIQFHPLIKVSERQLY